MKKIKEKKWIPIKTQAIKYETQEVTQYQCESCGSKYGSDYDILECEICGKDICQKCKQDHQIIGYDFFDITKTRKSPTYIYLSGWSDDNDIVWPKTIAICENCKTRFNKNQIDYEDQILELLKEFNTKLNNINDRFIKM